jgi:hypothetical protein
MMTRKDYVEVARILNTYMKLNNDNEYPALVDEFEVHLVEPFIEMFEKDNPNFNADKFWEACFSE